MTSNEDRLETRDRQLEHQIIKKRKTALLLVKKFAYESTGNVQ